MTDDEIDAAIRAVVPAECFRANAGARAIYRAGYEAGIDAAGAEILILLRRMRRLQEIWLGL